MIRAGITGGAGYTAGELIRILVNHPGVRIEFVHSESNAGNPVCDVHEGLIGDTGLEFCNDFDLDGIDVLFMCGAHGKSASFWEKHVCPDSLKVIDLAQDYRDQSCGYVYGLPEWQKDRIAVASRIANPGCFATAIQLGLLPAAAAGLLDGEVYVTAITGSTGAGVRPGETTHFSWRNDNVSTYKLFEHQHLLEINRNLADVQGSPVKMINFVPVRGDFSRGIFADIYFPCGKTEESIVELYKEYYRDAAFTFVSDRPVDLKQVVNTNKCVMHVCRRADKVVVDVVVDNLLKGASGQAVQNMNLVFGLPEDTGLRLKASAF